MIQLNMMLSKTCPIDVTTHFWACPLCRETEPAYFVHGEMRIQPFLVDGRQVFRLNSKPFITTHWRFNQQFYETLTQCVLAENSLMKEITPFPNGVTLTIVGPCRAKQTQGGFCYFVGNEIPWPLTPDPDGFVQLTDPSEIEQALQQNKSAYCKPRSPEIV